MFDDDEILMEIASASFYVCLAAQNVCHPHQSKITQQLGQNWKYNSERMKNTKHKIKYTK